MAAEVRFHAASLNGGKIMSKFATREDRVQIFNDTLEWIKNGKCKDP